MPLSRPPFRTCRKRVKHSGTPTSVSVPGAVEVAPNQPGTVYYVMTLDRREPATFAALYAPNGDEYRYKMMARELAARQQDEQWMGWLRQQAGLKSDWIPPDEAKKDEAARG